MLLLLKMVVVLGVLLLLAAYLVWAERKLLARFRYATARTGQENSVCFSPLPMASK
jgi:NADH:ubiquinone oxidoreductase subunit H